jgi:hypothetical protein
MQKRFIRSIAAGGNRVFGDLAEARRLSGMDWFPLAISDRTCLNSGSANVASKSPSAFFLALSPPANLNRFQLRHEPMTSVGAHIPVP